MQTATVVFAISQRFSSFLGADASDHVISWAERVPELLQPTRLVHPILFFESG